MKPAACKQCEAPDSELRRRVLSNGSIQYVYQCLSCGRSASNPLAKASVRNVSALPRWNEELAGQYDQKRKVDKAVERAEWFREHNIYLNSSEWKKRRAAVMKRAQGICEGCLSVSATQVHHLSYEHWREELLWELVAICDGCHERIHPHMTDSK